MPIHVPGYRSRKNKHLNAKRNVVAVLQLTAMVDMFTVLVVFLLQNYASTNQILPISDAVQLPKATSTDLLSPSFVVVVSLKSLQFQGKKIIDFNTIKQQDEWMIQPLKVAIEQIIIKEKKKQNFSIERIVDKSIGSLKKIHTFEKITLQADESIDVLTIKKIMRTLTAAGIKEINFAVTQVKKYPS